MANPNWKKGMKSPNPTGKSPGAMAAAREIFGKEGVHKGMKALHDIYTGTMEGFKGGDRLKALELLLAYGYGRPVDTLVSIQASESQVAQIMDVSRDDLKTLARMGRAGQAAALAAPQEAIPPKLAASLDKVEADGVIEDNPTDEEPGLDGA